MNQYTRKIFFLLLITFIWGRFIFAQTTDATLVIGTYKISKVTDGDTFRFAGLDRSTRLLGIDTEETFKDKKAELKSQDLAQNWPAEYNEIKEKKGNNFPAKTDTPFGFETWKWTESFVKDFDEVRLEKDDSLRSIDAYGRYLVYVILIKDGREVNYNIECVKLGYSPYFNKYGNCKRFDREFREAQEYAQKNKLGIWNKNTLGYPDYPQRIEWWEKRANQIKNFEDKYESDKSYFNLMNDGEYNRLSNYLDKEIVVFGNISDVKESSNLTKLKINIAKGVDFDLVIFKDNKDILDKFNINVNKEYSIYAKGKLKEYKGYYEIIINDISQLWIE
jgi:micrococcal nuclease